MKKYELTDEHLAQLKPWADKIPPGKYVAGIVPETDHLTRCYSEGY
jgi:hypothetical protein